MAMTLRLSDEEADALRAQAEAEDRSMQDVARAAVREYVDRVLRQAARRRRRAARNARRAVAPRAGSIEPKSGDRAEVGYRAEVG